jgi:hypothetical protein
MTEITNMDCCMLYSSQHSIRSGFVRRGIPMKNLDAFFSSQGCQFLKIASRILLFGIVDASVSSTVGALKRMASKMLIFSIADAKNMPLWKSDAFFSSRGCQFWKWHLGPFFLASQSSIVGAFKGLASKTLISSIVDAKNMPLWKSDAFFFQSRMPILKIAPQITPFGISIGGIDDATWSFDIADASK